MNKQLMQMVLPRLARPLYRHLEKFQTGELSEIQFSEKFEALLQEQHDWLARRGISSARAALAIHAAVLVLSRPGLRAEATEANVPLEVVEFQAVREAAQDVSRNYGMKERRVANVLAGLVASFGE